MVLIDRLTTLDSRGDEAGDARLVIVALVGSSEALAATTRKINDELRRHEPGDRATNLGLETEDRAERRAQVLNARHHVALVHVVRLDRHIRQLADQRLHRGQVVVHTPQQHALVAHHDAGGEELAARGAADPGDLAQVVEVRVHGDHLPALLAFVGDGDEGRGPGVGRVEDARRAHGEPFGREAEAADVRDREEAHADVVELVGCEIIGVAAGDDDVGEGGRGFDVGEHLVPASARRLQGVLGYGVRVGADGVGSGT